ncbi:hypothetical protein SDC9_180002 [bioreactor metagenome]|uniref:Uncharacterized protein n=1 Tax=bioreactor metagenome TaxID=1076179 RepID=A0A645H9Q4_9ZZZZ
MGEENPLLSDPFPQGFHAQIIASVFGASAGMVFVRGGKISGGTAIVDVEAVEVFFKEGIEPRSGVFCHADFIAADIQEHPDFCRMKFAEKFPETDGIIRNSSVLRIQPPAVVHDQNFRSAPDDCPDLFSVGETLKVIDVLKDRIGAVDPFCRRCPQKKSEAVPPMQRTGA